jgi:metallo-beta-lactamase family protein
MKIAFHGAARTVTGSKHVLTLKNGTKILLDCGMFQGLGQETDILNRDFGFNPKEISVMVLSHAHIDHTGLIPKLVAEGYEGVIYCTPATKDLTNVLLKDSAEIQEDEIKYANKKRALEGTPYLRPLYTREDAAKAAERLTVRNYNEWFDVAEGVQAMYTDAGHIIGSTCVHLKVQEDGKETHITFSGDVGRYRDVILRSPENFPQADYILMESTYGNSLHDSNVTTPDMLFRWLEKACLQKKGKLIMPAFSVGRTQELLFALNQLELENRLPDYSISWTAL